MNDYQNICIKSFINNFNVQSPSSVFTSTCYALDEYNYWKLDVLIVCFTFFLFA